MKRIVVEVEDKLHYEIKKRALTQKKSIKEIVIELLQKLVKG